MTDHDDPAFDDPAHEELRHLLASARVDTPLPDDVARRLEDTLAGLRRADANEAASTDDPGAVVPLHRRLAPRLLVAAAVLVVVGGVGGLVARQLGQPAGGGEAASDSAATSAQSGGATAKQDGAEGLALARLPQVRPDHVRADVARLVAGESGFRAVSPLDGTSAGAGPSEREPVPRTRALSCPGAASVRGPSVVVRYGDQPAALVLGPPAPDGGRTVEIWSCSGDARLARTVVPAGP